MEDLTVFLTTFRFLANNILTAKLKTPFFVDFVTVQISDE